MGRRKEFKVGKSFTLTIKTVGWIAEQCQERNMKASEWLERLICKERDRLKAKKQQKAKFYCVQCDKNVELNFTKDAYLCSECNEDHTLEVKYLMQMRNHGSTQKGST